MKRILITGRGGYIGTHLAQHLTSAGYPCRRLSLRDDAWRTLDFSGYQTIIHVAGIAHRKETADNCHEYETFNRDLTLELGKKAKQAGVSHFVFFSSMSVYGLDEGVINSETVPAPVSAYGKSKLEAEAGLEALHDERFCVTILRPPMVYGPGCPGNYQALRKLARMVPFFADYPNARSRISIDRLCACVQERIENPAGGIYLIQDAEYGNTCRIIAQLGAEMGRRIPLTPLLNPWIHLSVLLTKRGKKAFGTLIFTGETPCIRRFYGKTQHNGK